MTHGTIEPQGEPQDRGPGVGEVYTQMVRLYSAEAPLRMDNGEELGPIDVAFETYGELNRDASNVVVICHALTGDAHAAGHHGDPQRQGWWDLLVGPGRTVDTKRFFVVCANLLGGCRGTTGPSSTNPRSNLPYGLDFPAMTVADLVRVQRALLAHFGIEKIFAAIGGSLGGMQVLEWALQAPESIERAVIVCASAQLTAQNIALSTAAREGILRDPDFRNGRYVGTGKIPAAGLSAARMLGHVTYVSEQALASKFGRTRRDPHAPPARDGHSWFAPDFEVEHYLHYQADSFLDRFDPLSYLYLTRVMDAFAPYERPDHEERLERVKAAGTRFLVESFTSDWRFGPEHSDHLAAPLVGAGIPVERHNVASPWGHDSFLLAIPEHLELMERFLTR